MVWYHRQFCPLARSILRARKSPEYNADFRSCGGRLKGALDFRYASRHSAHGQAAESLETSPFLLIGGRRSVEGWLVLLGLAIWLVRGHTVYPVLRRGVS